MTKISVSHVNLRRWAECVPGNMGACVFRWAFSRKPCASQRACQGDTDRSTVILAVETLIYRQYNSWPCILFLVFPLSHTSYSHSFETFFLYLLEIISLWGPCITQIIMFIRYSITFREDFGDIVSFHYGSFLFFKQILQLRCNSH